MQILPSGLYQQLGAGQRPTSQLAHPAASESADPTQAFLDYMKKSPAQQMREQILARMGLTEDQLKAMSPDERRKVEDKIAQEIKKEVEARKDHPDKGGLVDVAI